ncbi:hypothetical protein H3146_26130 [Streptomyces sp. OF3]|uniref:Peptidase inhibitor n=1 Tax=Streptomyces alkaliterrae TaxID=2213162 RepID=A0A7W3ZQP7_9ACTN|nr:hypothetical protein [Streptomyces alkaliterrae]MBB1256797.1 hypothetical protein [Streptomyces alkaliterrae]
MERHVSTRRITRALAITGSVTAALVLSGPAQASPSATVDNCYSGQVCIYDRDGTVVVRSYGDWSSSQYVAARVIFNNGQRYPGADHVRWSGTFWGSGGEKYPASGCLHYQSTNSQTKEKGTFHNNGSHLLGIKSMKWGKECGANEPTFKIHY